MTDLVNSPSYHNDNSVNNVADEGTDEVINDNYANAVHDELVDFLFIHSVPPISPARHLFPLTVQANPPVRYQCQVLKNISTHVICHFYRDLLMQFNQFLLGHFHSPADFSDRQARTDAFNQQQLDFGQVLA